MNRELEKQKWLVFREDDFILVIPDSDIKPHGFPKKGAKEAEVAWRDCPCKPEISYQGDKLMVVHNSFQDQERVEEAVKNIIQ